MSTSSDSTLDIPVDLSERGKLAAQIILQHAREDERTFTGGCQAFYTPQEWKERGERYGHNSVLIVVHDGGDLGAYFDYAQDNERAMTGMRDALYAVGLYAENCTNWYTAIYDVKT